MIDKIPGGKLSAGLKNTLKDIISLFEKVGSGSQKASAIARRAAKTTMTAKETETVLKQIQNAVKQDASCLEVLVVVRLKDYKVLKIIK
jgi:hypothetical protein